VTGRARVNIAAKAFEYQIVYVPEGDGQHQVETLATLGAEGWELVSEVFRRSMSDEYRWVFKREIHRWDAEVMYEA
jgi:hypothetical protein